MRWQAVQSLLVGSQIRRRYGTFGRGLESGYVLADRGQASFSWDGSRIFLPAMTESNLARSVKARGPAPTPTDDLVHADLWHWKDDYIQPMQKVRAAQERIRTYRAVYHIADQKLVQLAMRAFRRAACRQR